MSGTETLEAALDREGSTDQKSICTSALLGLNKDQLTGLMEGQDVGIGSDDKESFRKLCHARINNVQSILPWSDVKLHSEAHHNW